MQYKIAIAGTGYVGLSNGILLAQNNEVVALDVIPEKVEMINQKRSPIQDLEIESYLLKDGLNFKATLNKVEAREDEDERHICPLQLDVIERCLKLWSNPGDLVFSPFAGIGSEGYQALKMDRRFLGVELKHKYYSVALKNLISVKKTQVSMFDVI